MNEFEDLVSGVDAGLSNPCVVSFSVQPNDRKKEISIYPVKTQLEIPYGGSFNLNVSLDLTQTRGGQSEDYEISYELFGVDYFLMKDVSIGGGILEKKEMTPKDRVLAKYTSAVEVNPDTKKLTPIPVSARRGKLFLVVSVRRIKDGSIKKATIEGHILRNSEYDNAILDTGSAFREAVAKALMQNGNLVVGENATVTDDESGVMKFRTNIDGEDVYAELYFVVDDSGGVQIKFAYKGKDSEDVTLHEADLLEMMSNAKGKDGKSAYDLWIEAGNEGSVDDFLSSLIGPQGPEGPKGDPGDKGEPGEQGEPGADGKSAYDIWLDNGGRGSESDFLASLKGEKGDTGDPGPQGTPGETGETGATGADGKSAYQIWLDEGHSGTEEDFLASLKGDKGDKGDTGAQGNPGAQGEPGESAYDIWVAQGGVGDEAAFLASLKGDKGDKGDPGQQGPPGADGTDGSPGVIISITGQTVTDPASVNMGDELVFSTDTSVAIDTVLSVITKQISVGWTVRNTGSATISVTNGGEEIASVDAGSSVSGKWIRTSNAVYISVFKRALGEGGSETKTPPYIEIDGGNIVIVGSESSTAAPQQLAGFVPNVNFIKVEGVVDISYLAFNAKHITAQENIDVDTSVITSANYAFSDSGITSDSRDWPLLTQAQYMYRRAESLESITGSTFPSVRNGEAMFARTYKLDSVSDLEMPQLKTAYYMFQYSGAKSVDRCYFGCSNANNMFENARRLLRIKETYFPNTTTAAAIYRNCPSLSDVDVHFPKLSTLNFTSTTGSSGLGNVTTLQNVTVLEGGLASCTSFIITNSTNLTDESIQNIIDALPDYSGTETSALVSFPPNRLSTEQQAQLTSKGWTWS